jgi:hypothetical protein
MGTGKGKEKEKEGEKEKESEKLKGKGLLVPAEEDPTSTALFTAEGTIFFT